MDLFEFKTKTSSNNKPLAEKMRPQKSEELLGLEEVFGEGSLIGTLLEEKKLPSLILWGPPGTGKTSFANIIAKNYGSPFQIVNAISTGAKELREICRLAEQSFQERSERSILFVDEVHRLNKAQQDVLLPFIESGALFFIGATTENPSFEVNSALMSRCRIVQFPRLSEESLHQLIRKSLDAECEDASKVLEDTAMLSLAKLSNGDARKCLNLVEQIVNLYKATSAGKKTEVKWPISSANLASYMPTIDLYFDRADSHYDLASALIKSIRASDPDAAIYYLARLVRSGEDPVFIARRLVISASEDIGNADPRALSLAMAAAEAVQFIGMPEAGINLAQVCTYLASAPKSNRSYAAYKKALAEVDSSGNLEVPLMLRNPVNKTMKSLGYGEDYQYDHSSESGVSGQSCLPETLKAVRFYEPSERGHESYIQKYLSFVRSQGKKS